MATVEVPDEIVGLFRPILEQLDDFGGRARKGVDVDFAADEVELMRRFAAMEAGCIGRMLAALDPVAPRVEVKGRVYRRMNNPNNEATYFAMRGPVRVARALYREEAIRNGPTIVPIELRAGIVEGLLTPAAAKGIAAVGQGVPSREAEVMCDSLGVLPYSRSEHFRATVDIGERWGEIREVLEDDLARKLPLSADTAAISASVDRVSLPMAEPRPLTAKDVAHGIKKPIAVNFRMAFAAVITTYDASGEPLTCIRYANVPTNGAIEMENALGADLAILLERRPDLTLVTLADGAPEMQSILARATANRKVTASHVDFWHLLEHLGEAATAADQPASVDVPRFRRMLLADDAAIEQIEAELKTWRLRYEADEVPEDLHAAITYVENNRDRMRYATTHASGLPIGSGTVEATGKTIVETRMRRAGARWVEEGAQPVLALRALFTSSSPRWGEALAHVVNSYKAKVKPLRARRSSHSGSP